MPGVAFYGKVRIPTIGHAEAIDTAKQLAKNQGAKLTIGLSHTNAPLNSSQKRTHAEKVFGHPVMTGDEHTKNLFSFLSHLNQHHDDLHLVAGSDRAGEYRKVLEKHNGKADKSGKVPFHFKSWKVHEVEGKREDISKDPTKMSRDELTRSVSASKLEKLAKEGNYPHFKAYHPGMPESHVKKVYGQIRKGLALNEEVTRKELAPMLDSFVSFASKHLGIKSMPSVRYKTDNDDYNSFAAYNPSSNELSVHTMNRHPMDIFRSVAHELVHHKQNEDGKLGKNIAKEGATGSNIENEANSEAGKIMRWFAKSNPDMFKQGYVIEEIANSASGVGIRGLGNVTGNPAFDDEEESNYMTQNLSDTETLKDRIDDMINKTTTDTFYTWKDNNWWMNSDDKKAYHAKTLKGIRAKAQTLNEGINDPGRLKAVFLAGGPGSGKDFVMNKALAGNGLREINSDNALEYLMTKHGLDMEMPDEERIQREILRGQAKNTTLKKEVSSLAGRIGLLINGTASDYEEMETIKSELEDLGYDTMMVFVNTSNEVSRERNVERGKAGGRKVPDGTDKQGNPNNSPDIRSNKWKLAQENISKFEKLFGKDKFAVIDNTADIRKVSPEQKNVIEGEFTRIRRMTMQFVQAPVQNERGKAWIKRRARYQGTTQYPPPKSYTKTQTPKSVETPKSNVRPSDNIMNQARRLGLSYYGFGRFGRKIGGENKVLYHSNGNQLVRVQNMNEEKEKKLPMSHKGKVKNSLIKRISKVKKRLANIDESFEDFMKKPANREEGTDKLVKNYKKVTPGQEVAEDNNIAMLKLPKNGGIGPEFGVQVSPALVTGFANIGNAVYEASKSIQEWALNPKTQQKFVEKYGDIAEQKLIEAALRLEEAGCGCDHSKPKSVKKIKEMAFMGASGAKDDKLDTMGTIPVQVKEAIDKAKMKCNAPRAQSHGSGEKGKSHVVKACSGGKEKIIRFGQKGVKGSPKKAGESEAYANRRKRFKARHAKNIKKGKMSAAYWANKVKW